MVSLKFRGAAPLLGATPLQRSVSRLVSGLELFSIIQALDKGEKPRATAFCEPRPQLMPRRCIKRMHFRFALGFTFDALIIPVLMNRAKPLPQ